MVKPFLLSSSLLPDPTLVKQWYSSFPQSSCRQQAYEQYANSYGVHEDKELSRFVQSIMQWPNELPPYEATPYQKLDSGIWIADLHDAYSYEPYLTSGIHNYTFESSLLAFLVRSAYTKASLLYIPKSIEPTEIVSLDTLLPSSALELLYIVVESGAQVTLQECILRSTIARSLYGFLLPGANVTCIRKQMYVSMLEDVWILSDNASLVYYETLQEAKSLTARTYYLMGDYARTQYTMLTALKRDEHAILLSKQYHAGKHTESSVQVKTALFDASRAFYRGVIGIATEAAFSQAEQYQSALMLSSSARVCAIPSLEIKAHEVQCRHGSAAGQVQEDHLWYLLSRGLDHTQAEKCIIEGFFSEALPIEQVSILLPSIY